MLWRHWRSAKNRLKAATGTRIQGQGDPFFSGSLIVLPIDIDLSLRIPPPARNLIVQLAFRILDLAARLLLALGVGCLLLAAYLSWLTLSFSQGAARATGEVVSYREISDGTSTRIRYAPRVRYKTVNGEIITIDGQFASTSKRFSIGEPVPLTYKVAKPTEARIALFTDNWLGPCIATVIGLLGLAGGFLVRRQTRRELARTRP